MYEYDSDQACDLIWENERQYSNECVRLLQPFHIVNDYQVKIMLEQIVSLDDYYVLDEGLNFEAIIQNTEISWTLYDTKGNYYSWVMPVSTYVDLLRNRDKLSEYNTLVRPKSLVNDYGEKFTIVSVDEFTYKGAFEAIIDSIWIRIPRRFGCSLNVIITGSIIYRYDDMI